MKKLKVWVIILAAIGIIINMTGIIIDFIAIDGDIDQASPWYEIVGWIIMAAAILLAIIYAYKRDKQEGKNRLWSSLLLAIFPAYLIISKVVDILRL